MRKKILFRFLVLALGVSLIIGVPAQSAALEHSLPHGDFFSAEEPADEEPQPFDVSVEELLDLIHVLPDAEEVALYTKEERDVLYWQVRRILATIHGLSSFSEEEQEFFYAVYETEDFMEKLFELNVALTEESTIVPFAVASYKVGGITYKLFHSQPGRDDYTAMVGDYGDNRVMVAGDIMIPATITVPNGVGVPGGTYTVTGIEHDAFSNNHRITSINFPDSPYFTVIEEYAFAYCTGLKGGLKLPSSLVTIEGEAFLNCSGLTGPLTFPASLTTIGRYAFRGCTGFSGELKIPDTVISIGMMAFLETNFSRVTHPKLISLEAELQEPPKIKRPDYGVSGHGEYEDSTLLLDADEALFFKAARWTNDLLTEAEIKIDYAHGVPKNLDVLFVLDYSSSLLNVSAPREGYSHPRSFALEDLVSDAISFLLAQNSVDGYDIRVGMAAFGSPGFGWDTNGFYYDNAHLQEELQSRPLLKWNATSYTDGLRQAIKMIEARAGGPRPCKIVFVSDGFPTDLNGNSGSAPGQPGIFDGTKEAQELRDMNVDVIPLGIYMPSNMSAEQRARAAAFFRNISFDEYTYFTAGDSFEFKVVWSRIITQEIFTIDAVITDTLGEHFIFRTGVAEADITASAGTAELEEGTGVVTWDLKGAAGWKVHTLTIRIRLKPDKLQSVGSLPTNLRLTSSIEKIDAGPYDNPSGSPFLARYIVEHKFTSGTPERGLPEEISIGLLPPFKGFFRNGAAAEAGVVPTLEYGGKRFEPGEEVTVGGDTWIFTAWDKPDDVINNANVLFTGTWKVKGEDTPEPARIRIKKVVEGNANSGDIFLIHLREKNQILGSVALQHDETSGWMMLDMGLLPYRTIDVSEIVPMEYEQHYKVEIQTADGDRATIQEGSITIYPGDSVTVIVTNTFAHTGFFKDKSWVRNVFATPGNPS